MTPLESHVNTHSKPVDLPDLLNELKRQIQLFVDRDASGVLGDSSILQCIDLLVQTWVYWALREHRITNEGLGVLQEAHNIVPISDIKSRIERLLESCRKQI